MKSNGFLRDNKGDKSSSRLCFIFIHVLVAIIVLYSIQQHYMTGAIRDVCIALMGIGWTGKVTQAYKEMSCAESNNS